MAITNYKSDKSMNQINKLSLKGLIVLEQLYLDMIKEEIFIKNNLAKGLETLTIVKEINKELLKRYEKRQ